MRFRHLLFIRDSRDAIGRQTLISHDVSGTESSRTGLRVLVGVADRCAREWQRIAGARQCADGAGAGCRQKDEAKKSAPKGAGLYKYL